MSMNLFLMASLDAETKLGKKVIREVCHLWQTPTKITRSILAIPDGEIFNAYKEWIISIAKDEIIPVYAEDDFFNEREPIGTETINHGMDHLQEVQEWLDEHKGWEIEWSEI